LNPAEKENIERIQKIIDKVLLEVCESKDAKPDVYKSGSQDENEESKDEKCSGIFH
jgi:hypothetical protein